MADRLRVTELDFDTIKTNLKSFLNNQTEFTDYDFEGSGLNVLIDLLAYNTHYNAYYLNMVANESFMDTALLRDSVVSHAKTLGYIPYSTASSTAIINFSVESGSNTAATLTIPSGYAFLSDQIDSKSYNFIVLEDTTVTKSNTKFIFESLELHEGQLVTYNFTHNSASNPKQTFLLPDSNIDTSTISILVAPSAGNTSTTIHNAVTDILDVTGTSPVYFLQENKNGRYQIYFGNDAVGKSLPDGAIVSATYLLTNGSDANKANNFVGTTTLTDSLATSLSNFTITPISSASGGADRESVDNIKFSATSQYSTQNRLVTIKDYESYILNKYPSIDSISVWGGEDNIPVVYGKVFVSLKPKTDYYISEAEKQRIIDDIITPKSIISVSTQILDPEFLYIIIDSQVQYDTKKTTSSEIAIKNAIRSAILTYSSTNLNKFSSKLVLSKLQDSIDSTDLNSIVGSKTKLRAQKRFKPTLNANKSYTISFNVKLNRGSLIDKVSSSQFTVNDFAGISRIVSIEEIQNSYTGVSAISISNPGTGYTTEPTVTITGDGVGATASATVVNGTIQSITITNRGIDYSRAIVTITGGNGYGAEATAEIDSRTGVLRTIYYDSLSQRQVVDSDVGTIDYDAGIITLTDIKITSVTETDGYIRISAESQSGIIESARNTIITIDAEDPTSIVTTLESI